MYTHRTLLQEVYDRRLSVGRIRCRISVYLPRVSSGLPPVRRHPFFDRVVHLVHSMVRAAMDGDGDLARWRFGRVHIARSFKRARDLHTEVTQYCRARLRRVVVEENVVAVCPQPRLATNKLPDLAQGWPPCRANRARRDLAPHRGQLARENSLYFDGDGHSSIINPYRDRVTVAADIQRIKRREDDAKELALSDIGRDFGRITGQPEVNGC